MPSFPRRLLPTILSACPLFLVLASHARSQDLIIDGPVTDTQVIDGVPYDTIIVTGDGSVTVDGSLQNGVYSTAARNRIINDGSVTTTGFSAIAIFNNGADTTIVNSGNIRTTQNQSQAIVNGADDTAITNNGDIWSTGNGADGILNISGDRASIINSGDIRTFGTGAYGIVSTGTSGDYADYATIINGGDIRTAGSGADGIVNDNGTYATISNSGAIRTSGNGADGIANDEGTHVSITNTGHIWTRGLDADGISNNDGTTVTITNSGAIISETSDAIFVRALSFATTVNLNAPSFLGGAITFESETTLNINTGASHSVLWQLPVTNVAGGTPNFSGPVPWFHDSTTGQFATFDPTGLTASFNQMAITAKMLGRLGRYGLRQAGRGGSVSAQSSALTYGEGGTQSSGAFDVLLATNSAPETAFGLKTGSFWLTGFGGEANHDGDDVTLDYSIDQVGAALGYAWNQSRDMRLGFMAGYMNGSITAESTWTDSQDITSNGVFAGVHGDRRFGRVTLGLGLSGGWQTSDSSRFVNDNTALTGGLTLGESTADASYDSWFVTPEAALFADIALGRAGIVLTPSIRGRYALQQTGSYTETGSAANATVDSHTFGVAEGDFELAVSRSLGLATLSGRAGYLVRSSTGDDDVPVTLLGITNSIGLGETDRSAAYLGAGLDLNLGPQASFTLDGQGYLSDDVDALEGMARLSIRF
ncbi:autotransporter domain-containing protein [Roseibium sp.]|uniref:autotransporter family protein n=1 Tax=Roseibium sp. TaxID=1936156 RepID=UPI003BAA1D1F